MERTKFSRVEKKSAPYTCHIKAQFPTIIFSRLTRLGLDLNGGTLSTLFALDAALAGRGTGSVLGLFGLLLALRGGLLVLGILNSLLASSGTSFRALASSLLDHIERGTDNSTLGLDNTASTLLGDFLLFATFVSIR